VNIATASELVVTANINVRRPAEVTGAGVLRIGGSATGVLSVEDEVAVDRVSLRTFGTIAGPKALQIEQHFDWQGGSIDATATVVTEPQATLLISTGSSHTLDGQLTVQGSGQWTGGGIGLGGTLLIESGGAFEIVSDQTISTRTGPAQVVNQGTLRKTTTTGFTTFSGTTAFVHSGKVDVQTGILYLDGVSTISGHVLIAAGAFVDVAGTFRMQDGSRVLGDGALRVGGSATGDVHVEADADVDSLTLRSFATVFGPRTATIRRHFDWQAGTIDHSAELEVDPAATFAISSSSSHTLDGSLILDGDGLWTGGGIALGGLLSLGPTATLEIEVDQNVSARTAQARVVNSGQIRKGATGGTTTFASGVDVINSGEWRVETGTFHFALGLDLFNHCEFPIRNLELAEFAIESIDLGGLTIGGGLGLGLLDIDADGDGVRDEKAMYGRILGQVAYSDVGVGVELIVTQYGPVLGRLFAGVPIPIGMLVGAVIGTVVPGAGTAVVAQIGDRTGFILTG